MFDQFADRKNDEKLPLTTQLCSNRKRNGYCLIWVKFTILQDKKMEFI